MDRAYVSRMVNLATPTLDIVYSFLDETLPWEVALFDFASAPPLLWDEQRVLIWAAQGDPARIFQRQLRCQRPIDLGLLLSIEVQGASGMNRHLFVSENRIAHPRWH